MKRGPSLLLALIVCGWSTAADPPKPEAVRKAVETALPVLWKGIDGHSAKRECFTCHNHAVPLLAMSVAKDRGFDVPEKKLAEQVEFITTHFEGMRERLEKGNGPGPSPVGGRADNTGYALFAFEILGVKPNKTTEAVAVYTLGHEPTRDHWPTAGTRPPTEASSFSTTYFAVRGLKRYGPETDKDRIEKRIDAAREWLLKTKPKDTEDRVFRLLGLQVSGATADEVKAAAKDLLDTQAKDGGWPQTDKLEPDAYATGTALYALHVGGGMKTDDPAYRRGLSFLLGTQREDGSWLVATRSKPIQKYFESGFPHEKDQFISCAATGWAATALAFDCKK